MKPQTLAELLEALEHNADIDAKAADAVVILLHQRGDYVGRKFALEARNAHREIAQGLRRALEGLA